MENEEADKQRLMNLSSLSSNEAVDAFEVVWLKQYAVLANTMKRLKQESANSKDISVPSDRKISTEPVPSDYAALYAELTKGVDAVFNNMQGLIGTLAGQFQSGSLDTETETKLEAIYARYCVICGDLYRYLDNHRRPRAGPTEHYRQSIERYVEAIRVNNQDGRAFSGMYIVAAAANRTLLSAVYLVKSVTVQNAFNVKADVLPALVKRIVNSPSELRDIDIPARAAVAAVLDLVCIHINGVGRERSDALVKKIAFSLPTKDVSTGNLASSPLPVIAWDSLLVILVVSAMEYRDTDAGPLREVLKLLIGHALGFKRPVPVYAAVKYVSSQPALTPLFNAIKRDALTLHPKTHSTQRTAELPLAIDHLIQVTGGAMDFTSMSTVSEDETAAARIRTVCGLTAGSSTPESTPRMASAPRLPGSKPTVIVDAANVACRAGQQRMVADISGIVSVVNHWTGRGHVVKIFVSEKHARRGRDRSRSRGRTTQSGMEINLDTVYDIFPEDAIVSIPAQNHDDSYMLEYALRVDGVIVSNDMFRDWSSKHLRSSEAGRWAEAHVIPYTLIGDMYIPNPDFVMPAPYKTEALLTQHS